MKWRWERVKKGKEKPDHTKPAVLGSSVAAQRAGASTPALLPLLPPPPLFLWLSLADKDTANLFGRQGHGWSRQTLLRRTPPGRPSPRYFVFPESIVECAERRSSAKPHSRHTFAALRYISSCWGHHSAAAVATAGIPAIASTARTIFQANYNGRNEDLRTMRAQFRGMETCSRGVDGAFADVETCTSSSFHY